MKYDVFICYRREGGDTLAQLIYDRLNSRGYKIFLDIEGLQSGKFNEKLFEVINGCKDVIVILSPGALDRCCTEDDWVYLELSHALEERKNVIPVLMKGFQWPETPPKGLEELQNYNGLQDSKEYFDAVIERLISMLKSRYSPFSILKNRFIKKWSGIDIRSKVRRKKRLLAGVVLSVLIVMAIALGFYARREEQLQASAEMVDIVLHPEEEMGVAEYYDAQEIIRRRLEILADGREFEWTVKGDEIHVFMPSEAFHGDSPNDILKTYVTRPIQISIAAVPVPEDATLKVVGENEWIDVGRDDILTLERRTGKAEDFGLAKYADYYEMDKEREYEFVEISFSDSVCDKIQALNNESDVYYFAQDIDINEYVSFDYMVASEEKNTFYIADRYQEDSFFRLMEYNYRNKSFEHPFVVNYLLPVDWENTGEIENPGDMQCDVWDLKEPYVTFQVSTFAEDASEGILMDYVTCLKKKLDALGCSYAFGKTVYPESPYGFTIRTSSERINKELMDMLASSSGCGLNVDSLYYSIITPSAVKNIEYEQQSDGTYQFSLVLDEDIEENWDMESYITDVVEMGTLENQEIFLVTDEGVKLAKMELSKATEGKRMVFDNLYYFGQDTITEDNLYLLKFLKEGVQTNAELNDELRYRVSHYRIDGKKDEDFGLCSVNESLREEETERILSVYPDANIDFGYLGDLSVRIRIGIEGDTRFPQSVNDLIQTIYKLSGISENEIEILYLSIFIGEEHLTFRIESNNHYHYMCYTGNYYGNGERYREFVQMLETELFYTETVKPDPKDAFEYN